MLKIDEVELSDSKDSKNFLIVLKALLSGIEITINGTKIQFAKTENGGVIPIVVLGDNDVIGLHDVDIKYLSEAVAKMTKEEIAIILANYTLNMGLKQR